MPSEFWKNYRLGEEVHISGVFIYNGLRKFHEMRKLDHADELFEFLYELSVGLERLLKAAVVLYEHNDAADQKHFESSLKTHSHIDLMSRLRAGVDIGLGAVHNDLLCLLGEFYSVLRYDRFELASVYEGRKEVRSVQGFLGKYLNVDFFGMHCSFGVDNEDQYRRFIRRTVLKIAREVYGAVKVRARKMGIYTDELRYGSKAESVFLREVDHFDEDVLWKELLIFFINTKADTGYLNFLRETPPLNFDPALVPEYVDCFRSDSLKSGVMDELEYHYGEMDRDKRNARLQRLATIGASNVYFEGDDDKIDESDPWLD